MMDLVAPLCRSRTPISLLVVYRSSVWSALGVASMTPLVTGERLYDLPSADGVSSIKSAPFAPDPDSKSNRPANFGAGRGGVSLHALRNVNVRVMAIT